jgi:hypothetical protein
MDDAISVFNLSTLRRLSVPSTRSVASDRKFRPIEVPWAFKFRQMEIHMCLTRYGILLRQPGIKPLCIFSPAASIKNRVVPRNTERILVVQEQRQEEQRATFNVLMMLSPHIGAHDCISAFSNGGGSWDAMRPQPQVHHVTEGVQLGFC